MYSLILLTYSSLIYLFGFFSNIFPSYICLWQHLTFITKKDQVEGRYLPNRDTHWYRQTFNFFAPFPPFLCSHIIVRTLPRNPLLFLNNC